MWFNNFTNERAKLSKGSDAKPRVKSSKGHDSRATEGTNKRLHTQLGTKAFAVFRSSLEAFENPPFCPISASGSNFNPRKILNVFMWLKFSPFLNLSKNDHFSQVSSANELTSRGA